MKENLKLRVKALELRVALLSKRLPMRERLAANEEFARECAALGWLREGAAEAHRVAQANPPLARRVRERPSGYFSDVGAIERKAKKGGKRG